MGSSVAPSELIRPLVDSLCSRFPSREEGLLALTDLTVLVAAADGTIDEAEMSSLTASLEVMLASQVVPMLVRHVVEESRERIAEAGIEPSARSLGASLAALGAAEDGIRLALDIAAASEGISDVERARIDLVAKAAGLTGERVAALTGEIAAD